MARTAKDQSNKQESEAQRSDAQTSANSTSMISTSSTTDASRLTAEQEQAQIQAQVDKTLGNKDEELPEGTKTVKVKTLGAYLLQDPTTGYSVSEKGDTVPLSPFIQKSLDDGRIEKA